MFTMENQIDVPRLPRKRRSLAQELVTVLSEQIRDGLLKRGDKLPTESAIMAAHGVSRTVVREAISRLQAAGQVETRHGIGTFVLDTPSPSGFRIDPATVVTLRDVLAILELRISLEVESAGLAAQRRSAEQLAGMRAALDALNDSTAREGDAVASDFQFHLQIALSTGTDVQPNRAATRPDQSNGSVKSSGSRVVSQSIKVNATRVAANPHHAAAVQVQPHRHTQYRKSAPVAISTNG